MRFGLASVAVLGGMLSVFLMGQAGAQGSGWDLGEGAIVLPGNGGVRFRVYAPGASTVAVAGEFNNWSPTANPLTRDAEGYYSATVATARTGQKYKYVVNGTLWRKDPWSLQVEGSDEGSNSVIADLKAYQWRATNWQTPRIEEVIIYQLHIKGFQYNRDGLVYAPGNVFEDFVETKLDYLTDLGVNCIHIMPVNEFPGEDSWGYNPVFFHAPESSYGTPEDLQRLVDECHLRGIAVILDVVHNHTDGQHNTHFWDFDGTANNEFGGNGQFYYNDDRARTFWGPEPNYGHPRTKARLLENVRVLAELYRIDGFRMDAVGFIRGESTDGNDWFGWQAEDGWQYLRDFNTLARSYHGGRFLSIAEDIASNRDITKNASEGGAGFLAQWAETDVRHMMSSATDLDRSVSEVRQVLEDYFPVNYGLHELVKYHSSHDKVGGLNNGPRLPVAIGDPTAWYARRRTMLANGLIIASPGAPLFFMGDEKYDLASFREQPGQGIDWTLRDRNRGFYEFSRDLFALKRTSPAMQQNHLEITARNESENLISWRRWGNNGEVVVFVANFSTFDKNFWVDFPSNGRWLQVVNSTWKHYGEFDSNHAADINVSNNWAELSVPGYSIIALSQTHILAPGRVWNVLPANHSSAHTPAEVRWEGTSRGEIYDVYFGTSESAVATASTTSPEFLGSGSSLTAPLPTLAAGTTYYWRVDSKNGTGTTRSEIFRFTNLSGEGGNAGRVTWTPALPTAGDSVTIRYTAFGGPLQTRQPVTAHLGFQIGGENWQNTTGRPMAAAGTHEHSLTVEVPDNAGAINVVFNHNSETWDNNGGADWTIPVVAAPGSGPEGWMLQ